VRIGLETYLQADPQLRGVRHVETWPDTYDEVLAATPLVVVMDEECWASMAGFAAVSRWCVETGIPVVGLVSEESKSSFQRAVLSKVQALVAKTSGRLSFLTAIDKALAGLSFVDDALMPLVLNQIRTTAEERTLPASVSPQEFRMLPYLADGYTNKEIALALGLSEKTVKNYLSNLMDKLQVTRRSQAAVLYASGKVRAPDYRAGVGH
jgi:DNA-binding NarL/FixJ family response regulator